MPEPSPPHVVVLGAGFAGLECCKGFRDLGDRVRVTLVDRQNHHLFQPLLYQVASAGLAAPEVAHPVRSVFARQKNVTTRMDEVRGIDPPARQVRLGTTTLEYDYLVVALGMRTGYFGNNHWAEHSMSLKSLDDAMGIRRCVLTAFERAEVCEDPEEKKRLMTVVVVGGGPTGVELAGTFAELSRHILRRDFRRIDTDQARIILIEASENLLEMYDEKLCHYTRRKLEAMGVTVLTGRPVQDVRDGVVDLGKGDTIEACSIIWAAGVEAVPVTLDLGTETDGGGRLIVEPDLSLPGHPEVFAVGDIAHCVDANGRRVPGLSPAAIQMGRHVAGIISEEIRYRGSGDRPAFSYRDKGSMATIGRSAAVAHTMGRNFTGLPAWLLWLLVHLVFLIGFRNKLAVLLQWFYAYARYRAGARIITGRSR